MNKFLMTLKAQAEQNPVLVMGSAAAVVTAIGKLITAHGSSAGSRAYAKKVNHDLKKESK